MGQKEQTSLNASNSRSTMYPKERPMVCLAPMDGITDSAYRRIVRRLNPGVVLFSEFTSVNGMKHSDQVRQRLNFNPVELPYIVQLFGNEPELFTETVKAFNNTGITGVDINMGCPAKKIIRSNCGGSLMRDRELACRIVSACRKATELPISVKTRLGWSDAESLLEFVDGVVSAGASLVTIHGRTYKQRFRGEADWTDIYKLREKYPVPVIGNGDVKGKEEAELRLKNLDGYMIGRAAIGNPWVFWSDSRRAEVTLNDKIPVMIDHFQLLREYTCERVALIEFRKHISGYISGFDGAKSRRSFLMGSESEEEFIHNALSLC